MMMKVTCTAVALLFAMTLTTVHSLDTSHQLRGGEVARGLWEEPMSGSKKTSGSSGSKKTSGSSGSKKTSKKTSGSSKKTSCSKSKKTSGSSGSKKTSKKTSGSSGSKKTSKKTSGSKKTSKVCPPTCEYVLCDFNVLRVGGFFTNQGSSSLMDLEDLCLITNISAEKDGQHRDVNVFDSMYPHPEDLDLGAPNHACPHPGPGVGDGGGPYSGFPNCEPQGNLLIIQNPHYPEHEPNDAFDGGCITIDFASSIDLTTMALLDWEEDYSDITVYDSYHGSNTYTVPAEVRNNGLWVPGFHEPDVVKIKACMKGSGSISSIGFNVCH